jgi:DNA-binding NarL/FixJ family response regulator
LLKVEKLGKIDRPHGSAKSSSACRISVCFVSPHPLVLAEFEKLLPPHDYQVKTYLLESFVTSSAGAPSLPRASVYVVDSFATRPAATLIAEIADRFPRAHVLAVAEKFGRNNAFPLLRGRSKGLLTYQQARAHLPRALEVVSAGGFWVPRALLSKFVDWVLSNSREQRPFGPMRDLSRREQEVLEAVLGNLSNKQIAQKLGITERTAKFHVSNLLAKFKVQRRADLILLHFQHGPGSVQGYTSS